MNASYRLLSYQFRVRTELAEAGKRIDQLLERFRIPDANGAVTYEIRPSPDHSDLFETLLDDDCVQRAKTDALLVDHLLWHVSGQAIERVEDSMIALHAGAVSYEGAGLLLPAPPDSGKTTLSAALVRSGFDYLSDEAALIDPESGFLYPFPRPFWMERPTVEAIPGLLERQPPGPETRVHHHVPPEDLRPGSVGGPCRVRFVIAPSYRPGSPTKLESMGRAEAVVLLGENSFNFGRFGARALPVLRDLVAEADCYRLSMRDIPSAVAAVRGVVEGDVSPDPAP